MSHVIYDVHYVPELSENFLFSRLVTLTFPPVFKVEDLTFLKCQIHRFDFPSFSADSKVQLF